MTSMMSVGARMATAHFSYCSNPEQAVRFFQDNAKLFILFNELAAEVGPAEHIMTTSRYLLENPLSRSRFLHHIAPWPAEHIELFMSALRDKGLIIGAPHSGHVVGEFGKSGNLAKWKACGFLLEQDILDQSETLFTMGRFPQCYYDDLQHEPERFLLKPDNLMAFLKGVEYCSDRTMWFQKSLESYPLQWTRDVIEQALEYSASALLDDNAFYAMGNSKKSRVWCEQLAHIHNTWSIQYPRLAMAVLAEEMGMLPFFTDYTLAHDEASYPTVLMDSYLAKCYTLGTGVVEDDLAVRMGGHPHAIAGYVLTDLGDTEALLKLAVNPDQYLSLGIHKLDTYGMPNDSLTF